MKQAMTQRGLKRAITAAVVTAMSLPLVISAGAQERAPQTERARTAHRLRLASQTSWVGRGHTFVLRLQLETPRRADAEIAVTVYQRVANRSEFARSLRGTVRGSAITVASAPLSEMAVDAGGAVGVQIPLQDPAQPRDPERVQLTRDGVYPVRVELRERGGGEVLARFTTHLVHTAEPLDGTKLGFVWIVPLHAPPAIQPDATRALSASRAAGIGAVVRALEAHPGVPVVLRPTPETIEAMATSTRPEDHDVVPALSRALAGRQVLASTYVPVSVSQLLGAGLDDELAAQRSRGTDIVNSGLRLRADPRTWVADGRFDEATLADLRRQQVDRLVVEDAQLTEAPVAVTLAQPFSVEGRPTGRRTIRAMSADPGLAAHLQASEDPTLSAHQLLADLAVVHFDRPGRPRAVVGVTPRSWKPDPRFLDVVLGGLAESPVVQGTTLDAAFSTIPAATTGRNRPLVRRLAPATRASVSFPTRSLRAARSRLDAFGALVAPGNPVYEGLDRVLLTGQSVDLGARARVQYLDGVQRGLDAELDRILMPNNRSITLTARRGEIPVTVQSRVGYAIKAVIRVESDKLEFPEGSSRRVELERENTTERFAVRARTSGAFPLRVILESEDRRIVLGRSLFTVRSTAASGVGVILSVGAGTFLVLWWARHLLQSRRAARAEEVELVATTPTTTE